MKTTVKFFDQDLRFFSSLESFLNYYNLKASETQESYFYNKISSNLEFQFSPSGSGSKRYFLTPYTAPFTYACKTTNNNIIIRFISENPKAVVIANGNIIEKNINEVFTGTCRNYEFNTNSVDEIVNAFNNPIHTFLTFKKADKNTFNPEIHQLGYKEVWTSEKFENDKFYIYEVIREEFSGDFKNHNEAIDRYLFLEKRMLEVPNFTSRAQYLGSFKFVYGYFEGKNFFETGKI